MLKVMKKQENAIIYVMHHVTLHVTPKFKLRNSKNPF